eukprot:GHUV01006002.1.p1 GENE.GHUV01006002.1~~GHUV01006002.1.p1  ORF type:complete len:209 (+),score=31.72 GHUV01006002.1:247-873(+)
MISGSNLLAKAQLARQGCTRWLDSTGCRPVTSTPRGLPVARVSLRPGETPEEAQERRLRESQRVEERVTPISDLRDWDRETQTVGDKLVVVEVESDKVCQTGLEEEAELHWKADQAAALKPCQGIKHTFARIARECPDVKFLSLNADDPEASEVLDVLGVEVIPSVQFWRNGKLLWEHRGVNQFDQGLGEGVLYFGDRWQCCVSVLSP